MNTTTAKLRAAARRLRGGGATSTVRSGPGRGLRIGSDRASGDYRSGTNELAVQEAIVAALGPGDVFYDVGANVGYFALLAARCVGDQGISYAFEPVQANIEAIAANRARNGLTNVVIVPGAVGERAGSATLYLDAHPGGATLSAGDRSSVGAGQVLVDVQSIDELVARGSCRPPSVVKIDVEGAEPAVLRGMARTVVEHRPVIICEVDAPERDRVEQKVVDVTSMLDVLGYGVERLPDSYADTDWEVVHLVGRPVPSVG